MRTQIKTDESKSQFNEVRVIRDEETANSMLASGWTLLNAGTSHTDNAGYQAKVHFILAK